MPVDATSVDYFRGKRYLHSAGLPTHNACTEFSSGPFELLPW